MTIKFAAGLKEHLTELWGPPGTEDFSLYADDLEFKDPLVAVKGLNLFKLNFKILKDSPLSYEPEFITHDTAAVGPRMARARWTVTSTVRLLPWKPRVSFTGVSIYKLNEQGKVVYHEDVWDSVQPGEFLGGLRDTLFRGSGLWREQAAPDVFLPPVTLLYRGVDFELRRVDAFRCAEVQFDKRSQKDAVAALNGYWTGGNLGRTVLPPSQPTLIICPQMPGSAPQCMSAFLPGVWGSGERAAPPPIAPAAGEGGPSVTLGSRSGRVYAVQTIKTQSLMDGWVSTEEVYKVRAKLLDALLLAGISPTEGFTIARYGEVYGTGSTYYELWVGIEAFSLRAATLISAAEDPSALERALDLNFEPLDDSSEA